MKEYEEYNGLIYNEDFTFCFGPTAKNNTIIELHPNTISIQREAFKYYKSVEKIVLNNNLTTIDNGAFSGCNNLKEINFPSNLKSIGTLTFADTCIETADLSKCKNLELGIHCFQNASIKNLYLPNNLEKIPKGCFCYNDFVSVKLPSTLKEINIAAFFWM